MDVFLDGTACISPQPSFDGGGLAALAARGGVPVLQAVEPAYRELFTAGQLRRMSRIARMAVAAAQRALRRAGTDAVDAVATGTGLGCFEESERFLEAMLDRGEEHLNPSVFIQATHHAASSQVAFAVGCRGYHVNYAHRALSFETALLDAALLVGEGAVRRALVGGMDEYVPNYERFLERAGLLPGADSEGRKPLGEGAAFFVLSPERGPRTVARLQGVRFAYRPEGPQELERLVAEFLAERSPGGGTPDLVLVGGPSAGAATGLGDLARGPLRGAAWAAFTPLCGEYHTASAFALWLAAEILREGRVPAALSTGGTPPHPVESVLVLTGHRDREHAWTLLDAA